jgi:hypothetical protein
MRSRLVPWAALNSAAVKMSTESATAVAGNRRFGPLSALRAHTKAPYRPDSRLETLRALNHPGWARTDVAAEVAVELLELPRPETVVLGC